MKWCDDLILQNQMIPPEEFCLIALHCHLHHLITFRFSFTFTISRWPELEKSDNCYVSTLSLSLWPELVLHHITGIEWDKALQSVIDCSGRQTPPVHSVNDGLKTLTQPQQRTNKKGTKCLTRWAPSGPSLNHVKLGELYMGPSSRLVTPCWACLFVFCLFVSCLWCKIRADPWQINS